MWNVQIEISCAGTGAPAIFVEVEGGPTRLPQLHDTWGIEAGMVPYEDGHR